MADAARKRVLLIDTTPKMAAGWRHRIQDLSDRWEIEVATGREQAEEILGRGGVDLVAAALDLPGGGAAFLDAATERQPGLVGIVLIDDLAEEQGAGVADLPYHAVPKSCHPEDLNDVMLRAQALASLLGDARLKKSIAQIRSLPTLPELYRELMAELRKEEPSLDRVGEIVSRDLGMTAKMLKLINSALFALPREVTTPAEAVVFLGVETVKALALSLQVFSQFKFVSTLSVEALWNHSWVTGVLAKRIALSVHAPKAVADQSFISGLLHDVGKLVLATNRREQYQGALKLAAEKRLPVWQAETELCGASHAEVGAYLLGLWKLPSPVVEALAFHHRPLLARSSRLLPLAAVHVANVLDHEQRGVAGETPDSGFDEAYLEQLGLDREKLDQWRQIRAAAA